MITIENTLGGYLITYPNFQGLGCTKIHFDTKGECIGAIRALLDDTEPVKDFSKVKVE